MDTTTQKGFLLGINAIDKCINTVYVAYMHFEWGDVYVSYIFIHWKCMGVVPEKVQVGMVKFSGVLCMPFTCSPPPPLFKSYLHRGVSRKCARGVLKYRRALARAKI